MATGNSINLASSASGDVITSQGASSPPIGVVPSSVGGIQLLNTYTPSSAASVNITSQISATFNSYTISISNFACATNTASLKILFSTDNGVTWDTTAAHYAYFYNFQQFSIGPTTGTAGSASTTGIIVANSMVNGNNLSLVVDLINPGTSTVYCIFEGSYISTGPKTYLIQGGGAYIAGTSINAMQLIMSSGNISTGTVKIYGYVS